MRFSNYFIPTTKETPNDATLPSHQYLIRAGFISQQGSGLYNFLPLGKIVLDKIRQIVKEELDKAGAIEVQLGFVTPLALWEESGRDKKMGLEMLRIKDRKQNEFVLSPTNEEAMVDLVKNRITSYKDLPINLYQINTKFRDEARPRFGLLRGREFLMKDGYSFHCSTEDMQREFMLMQETYSKIFTRLGLEFRAVEADSGAIGGSGSKEFHVIANSGEDTIVVCNSCQYAANIEAAKRRKPQRENKQDLKYEMIHTPNITTIEQLCEFFDTTKDNFIKAVAKKAIYEDGTSEVVVFFINGNSDLEETKALNSINALELTEATSEDILGANLVAGFIGIENLPQDIKVVFDKELQDETSLITGSNKQDYHTTGVDIPNDVVFDDIIAVKQNDTCICGGKLRYTKGIEVGHIFQLGTRYSSSMDATFLDQNGKKQPFVMGTYGIGVSRLMAAVIEQNHDDKGCIWTKQTTPFFVDVIVSNAKKEQELDAGLQIYHELNKHNIPTIIDDRKKERFGFKIKDFELIGFCYAIVVGKKLQDGLVELICRRTDKKIDIKIEDTVDFIKDLY
jgi:prolyl-tRNA synthetase